MKMPSTNLQWNSSRSSTPSSRFTCEGKYRQRQTKEKVGMNGSSLRINRKLMGEQQPRPKDIKNVLTLEDYSSWQHVTPGVWKKQQTSIR